MLTPTSVTLASVSLSVRVNSFLSDQARVDRLDDIFGCEG